MKGLGLVVWRVGAGTTSDSAGAAVIYTRKSAPILEGRKSADRRTQLKWVCLFAIFILHIQLTEPEKPGDDS